MHMLYDSETFSVMHMLADSRLEDSLEREADKAPLTPELLRHGFEIVDKRSNKEVYLDGSWAELFQQRIAEWQRNMPTQEEVEDTLEQYAELAHTPVAVH
jgi:Protein of unknown function (DUF3567)